MLRIFVKYCVRVFTLLLFRVKTYGQENIEEGIEYDPEQFKKGPSCADEE